MADSSGQKEIRGIDIDKLAKGFADELLILRKFIGNTKTKAREIRWYQKTAGFLDSVDTTGITDSQIANTSSKTLAPVVEQSWTRQVSYVRKYFVESPTLTEEDIADSDVDVLATNVRDLVRGVENQIDRRIYNVVTENLTPVNINTAAAIGTGWDDEVNGNPIKDLLIAKQKIRAGSYDPEGAILYINSVENQNLLNWLISVKGSSIPGFSSEKVKDGIVLGLLGLRVVVSENATTDYALVFVSKMAATWKSFKSGLHTAIKVDEGIGRKIRVWQWGEAILHDPKAVTLITDTVT